MGQSSSSPGLALRRRLRRASLTRRSRSTLSHAFALVDGDDAVERMDINAATEEELMTLPGVTREIARNMVAHRKAIGRFRRVEDLVLVRGVGAERLERMRLEICVSRRGNGGGSRVSSRAQSVDSLGSRDSRVLGRNGRVVDVNEASVFDLQVVPGVTQEIAANIVEYRGRKGMFKRVDDLIKVKGIDRIRLSNIGQFLTVNTDSPTETFKKTPTAVTKCNGITTKLNGINGTLNSSLLDIFELLSVYSPRTVPEEIFDYERQGESAVRIAVWNLEKFSLEKASNLGVREVVCRTILENGWSIVAIQEVADIKALQLICDELNRPKLRKVADWKRNSRDWTFSVLDTKKSGLGFLFDCYSGGIEVELMSIKQGPKELRGDCEVGIGTFKVGGLIVNLINGRFKGLSVDKLDMKLQELITEEEITLLLIDNPEVESSDSCFLDSLALFSFAHAKTQDNNLQHRTGVILGNNTARAQLTGVSGIVRDGLSHLAIPAGWNWGGEVSSHLPVWTEIFVNPNSGTAL